MAKVDKLKKLIENLGGECPASDNISDCLDALCGCEIGGGGGVYPIFIDRNVSTTISSYDDMVAAINAGQLVFVVYKGKSGGFTTYVMSYFDTSSGNVYFSTLQPHNGKCDELVIYNTGVSSVDGYTVSVEVPK